MTLIANMIMDRMLRNFCRSLLISGLCDKCTERQIAHKNSAAQSILIIFGLIYIAILLRRYYTTKAENVLILIQNSTCITGADLVL